ncbi:hypothetical protein GETHLI_32640 [Geothrix limicola]|uniref:Virulence-associated protein E-like domain-containing protein n=1 Tax=Geothrix limicola TaxID=2927978 RepID=A0ABQ5QJI4_9BACT|nr:virulence-associated E family protein [Geothrix limicola]GLH74762.1 hypothetical protein GETHLI_32640 [Geothrix limicola]
MAQFTTPLDTPENTPVSSPLIRCSRFTNCRDNTPKNLNASWEELTSPAFLGRAYEVQGATKEEAKLNLYAFSPAAYPPGGIRGDRDIESIQIFMLDFDNKAEQPTGEFKENGEPVFRKVPIEGAPTLQEVHEHLTRLGVTHFGYHSYSSTPECERFRIMLLMDRPSNGKNWKLTSEWLLSQLMLDRWRAMGCLDLGAMHRAACLYFPAGNWAQEPEAKDRIQFVSYNGAPLALPTEEDLADMTIAPVTVHPLLQEWQAKRAATRVSTMSSDPDKWQEAYNVDFKTLDMVGLLREMGSTVQEPVPYGSGTKARCTCPFAHEHSNPMDAEGAAVFMEPGSWPGFTCLHDTHKDVHLREVCHEAGEEILLRHAQPFRSTTGRLVSTRREEAKHAVDSEGADAIEAEVMNQGEGDPDEAKRNAAIQRWKELLEEDGIPTEEIRFTSKGGIAKSPLNLEIILTNGHAYRDSIRWNELKMITELQVADYAHLDIDDLDNGVTGLQNHLDRRWGVSWPQSTIILALNLAASSAKYHPVKVWLAALPEWDGVDRMPLVRDEILGATQTLDYDKYAALYAEYLKCTLIGAVRRVMEPGCKMDTVTILYGDQAARKSTFWKTLCADPGWFNDSKIHIDSAEGQKVLQGSWIHELSEIDDMTSVKSAEAIKAFVSSATDKFRPSYGRIPRDFPRRCIMVGSTNKEQVLNDPTGSRRFWVIPTATKINIELLQENLAQLWAQALHSYNQGEPNYLTDDMEALRVGQSHRHQMESRYADLMPKITQFYQEHAGPNGITLSAIFGFLEGKVEDGKGFAKPTLAERRDLAACLRSNGWTVKQGYFNGVSAKCFMAPEQFPLTVPKKAPAATGFEFPGVDLSGDPFKVPEQGPLF